MRSDDTTIDNFLTWSFDYKNLDNQVELRCWAIVQEISRQLERDFPKDMYRPPAIKLKNTVKTMKKLKDPPLMFPQAESEPFNTYYPSKDAKSFFPQLISEELDVTYPLPKEQLRVITIYPPQGKQHFYGIKKRN